MSGTQKNSGQKAEGKGGNKPGAKPLGKGRPRLGARVAAVQALFQSEASGESAEAIIQQFISHRLGTMPGEGGFEEGRVPQADVPLFVNIVRAVAKNAETLDPVIAGHLSAGWSMERLDPVLRALLRAAAGELWSGKEPPAKVVINEYMDVAHGFFDGSEPRFANGVLDAIAKHLRGGELGTAPASAG